MYKTENTRAFNPTFCTMRNNEEFTN